MRTKASIGIGEAWPVLPPRQLVRACTGMFKPAKTDLGEKRYRGSRSGSRLEAVPDKSFIKSYSLPAKQNGPRRARIFRQVRNSIAGETGVEDVGPGRADLRNGDGAHASAINPGMAVAAHYCECLQARRKAGTRYGRNQANVVGKDSARIEKESAIADLLKDSVPPQRI